MDENNKKVYLKNYLDKLIYDEIPDNKSIDFKNGNKYDYTDENLILTNKKVKDNSLPSGISYIENEKVYRVGMSINCNFINMGKN